MRTLPIASLVVLILLAACDSVRKPNAANFTQAINQSLAKHGETCTSIGRQFPIDIPASFPQSQNGFGPQLTALEGAGLVSETDTTAVVHGMLDSLRGTAPPQRVRRYQLTPEGQKYFKQVPGAFGQTGGFCYGQKIVDSVVKWSDPMTVNGASQTEITYTYRIANLAGWAEQPAIQQAFPDIKAAVDGTSKTSATVGLQLTDNGWEAVGR